jgi:hypothetical protein
MIRHRLTICRNSSLWHGARFEAVPGKMWVDTASRSPSLNAEPTRNSTFWAQDVRVGRTCILPSRCKASDTCAGMQSKAFLDKARTDLQRSLCGSLPDLGSSSRMILQLARRLRPFFTAERESASCSCTHSNSAWISFAGTFLSVKNWTTRRYSMRHEESQTWFFERTSPKRHIKIFNKVLYDKRKEPANVCLLHRRNPPCRGQPLNGRACHELLDPLYCCQVLSKMTHCIDSRAYIPSERKVTTSGFNGGN